MRQYLDETQIHETQEAFLSLAQQLQHLLGSVEFYLNRHRAAPLSSLVRNDLGATLTTISTIPTQLGEELKRWSQGLPRVMSAQGVQDHLLNELWLTMNVVSSHLTKEGCDLHPYNPYKLEDSLLSISRANWSLS